MPLPTISGLIARRLLINYLADPAAIASILPPPFRPKLINNHAVAGICLIGLRSVRPSFLPAFLGLSSENAAHRIAVQWGDHGQTREGVYIPRRDTSSRLNALAGGRLFPGLHHHARFTITDTPTHLHVSFQSDDRSAQVSVTARPTTTFSNSTLFPTLDSASDFFHAGSLGYSATHTPTTFDGLELDCDHWQVTPLHVDSISSSFFDNPAHFPKGTAIFDNALLMRNIPHRWHSRGSLCCTTPSESSRPSGVARV